MPTFTIELWRLIDLKPEAVSVDEWLNLHNYPIFQESYRETLNRHILDNFMYQEIGQETPDAFRHALGRKMRLIMPSYNQLFESALTTFDPLVTVDMVTSGTSNQTQTSEGTSTNNTEGHVSSESDSLQSAYPNTMITPNGQYGTSGGRGTSKSDTSGADSNTSEANNTAQGESETRMKGYQGVPADLIAKARATIINVDQMIIAELDELFMLVWNNSDSYSNTYRNEVW